jgi:hypothetical protein
VEIEMTSLPALLAAAGLAVGMTACGGTDKAKPTSSHRSGAPVPTEAAVTPSVLRTGHAYLNDGDNDIIGDADQDNNRDNDNDNPEDHKPNDNDLYHDSDDESVVAFGHEADAADKHAITAIVKRYYAVGAAGDGTMACSMLSPGLARAVPEDYGRNSAGPAYLRAGTNCPGVMDLLFRRLHAQLVAAVAVTSVRVSHDEGFALLGSQSVSAGDIAVLRQDGVWKIDAVLGGALP